MTGRRVQLVLLCEDRQQEAFLRRFFQAAGLGRRVLRVERCSTGGQGAAEQWVRSRYAPEVRGLRSAASVARALVVAIDADTAGVQERERQLTAALKDEGLRARKPGERILHIIPERNIETWLRYLQGNDVDTATAYPRLPRERDCAPLVTDLKAMCDSGALRKPAPPSLERACKEYRARLK